MASLGFPLQDGSDDTIFNGIMGPDTAFRLPLDESQNFLMQEDILAERPDPLLLLEEGSSQSAHSTPNRRIRLPLTVASPFLSTDEDDDDDVTLLSMRQRQQQRQHNRCRCSSCSLVLWMVRSVVVVAVIYLVVDGSNIDAFSELAQAAGPLPPPPPPSKQQFVPNAANQLSHARSLESPEFRLLQSILSDESSSSNTTNNTMWWLASGIFCLGVGAEVWWKEVYQKQLRASARRRSTHYPELYN